MSVIFKQIIKTNHSTKCTRDYSSNYFTYQQLISDTNKKNCMKCWRKDLQNLNTESLRNVLSAAVLIPMCVSKEGEVSLLYTKRSPKLSRHPHQISFPGGIKDKTDDSYEECALRETMEETGLNKKRVQVWGSGNVIRAPERPPIVPVIGVIKDFSLKELKLNKDEVEEAFTVPIKDLCSSSAVRYTQFKNYSLPVFRVETKQIWGITAVITRMFLSCLLPKNIYNHEVIFIKRPFKIDP